MKIVVYMFLLLLASGCKTCPQADLIASKIAGQMGQTFECASDFVLEDVQKEVKALDICGNYDQLKYVKNTPGGIQNGESIVCYTVVKKVQPSKSWECKKALEPKELDSMCSKF